MSDSPSDASVSLPASSHTLSLAEAETLIRTHGPMVLAACRRILRDGALAEDAAQETFLLLVRKRAKLPPAPFLGGWLYRCACHVALSQLRVRRRREAREQEAFAMNNADNPVAADPERVWTELEPWIDEAMAALPERRRDLVVARFFEERSQRDLAKALGWSEAKVSRELHAGLETLRVALARRGVKTTGAVLAVMLAVHATRAPALAQASTWAAAMAEASSFATANAGGATAAILMTNTKKLGVAAAALLVIGAAWWGMDVGALDGRELTAGARGATRDSSKEPALDSHAAEVRRERGERMRIARADARALFEKVPVFANDAALNTAMWEVLRETDVDKRMALLERMGVGLSRAAVERMRRLSLGLTGGETTAAILAHNVRNVFEGFLTAWAREQPAEAAAWILSQPGFDESGGRAAELVKAMVSVRLEGEVAPELWDALIEAGPRKSNAKYAATMLRAVSEPEAFVRGARGLNPRDHHLEVALGVLVEKDAASAIRAARAAGDDRVMQSALSILSQQRGGEARLRELALSADFIDSPKLQNLLLAMGGDPAADFVAARKALGTDLDANFRYQLDVAWARADRPSALRDALSGNDELWSTRFHIMLREADGLKMSEADLEAVLAHAAADRRRSAWNDYYLLKAREDPAGALAAIRSNADLSQPGITGVTGTSARVVSEWAQRDPGSAIEWVAREVGDTKEREALLRRVALYVSRNVPESALWIARESGLQVDERLATGVADTIVLAQGLGGAAKVLNQFDDPKIHDAALGAVAGRAFAGDWAQLAAYVEANAKGDVAAAKLQALGSLPMDGSTDTTMMAMRAFGEVAVSSSNEKLAIRVAGTIAANLAYNASVTEALRWSSALPDGLALEARGAVIEAVLHPSMPQSFRSDARGWIERSNLSAEEKARLVARLK